MNKVIYKYPVRDGVDMPANAEILKVEYQGAEVFIWAMTIPDSPTIKRYFKVYGTGHPIPMNERYVGTVFEPPYVWHIMESTPLKSTLQYRTRELEHGQ